MKTLRLLLMLGVLIAWQVPAHAGNAVMLKAYAFQETHEGYPMPKRMLNKGAIVKVLSSHGARTDVVTSGGFTVSVRSVDLHLLPDVTTATAVATPPTPATPTPATPSTPKPVPTPPPKQAPSPTPNPSGEGEDKPKSAGSASSSETGEKSASVRCSHVTKKGEQCSRMTASPNGLCWQHGGD